MLKQIAILGAGITGLSLAYFLKKKFGDSIDLKIFEAAKTPGGWVRSSSKEGFFFEEGPRMLRTKGAGRVTLQLIDDLGLKEAVIFPKKEAHKRYILSSNELLELPSNPLKGFFSPLLKGSRLDLLKGIVSKQYPPLEEESIYSFASRRFSKQIAEQFFDPLGLGIFGADIKHLSYAACFPTLYKNEKQSGYLWERKSKDQLSSPFIETACKASLFSLKGGLSTLINKLQENLRDELLCQTPIHHIEPAGAKMDLYSYDKKFTADLLFSTLSPQKVSEIVPDFNLNEILKKFRATTLTTAHLGFHEKLPIKKGFGYLIPTKENQPILGMVFDSHLFEEHNLCQGQTRLTVMLQGEWQEQKALEACELSLETHLGVKKKPDFVKLSLKKDAIGLYAPGFLKLKETAFTAAKNFHPNFHLVGSHYDGVSLNECIKRAKDISHDDCF